MTRISVIVLMGALLYFMYAAIVYGQSLDWQPVDNYLPPYYGEYVYVIPSRGNMYVVPDQFGPRMNRPNTPPSQTRYFYFKQYRCNRYGVCR